MLEQRHQDNIIHLPDQPEELIARAELTQAERQLFPTQQPLYEKLRRNAAEISPRKLLAVGLIGFAATTGAFAVSQDKIETAAAAENRGAMASNFVKAPKLPPGSRLGVARQIVRRSGLIIAGLVPNKNGKPPVAKPGYELVAAGLAKRVVKKINRPNGQKTVKVLYPTVKPGSRLERGSRVYIRTRLIQEADQGDLPGTVTPPPAPLPVELPPVTPLPPQPPEPEPPVEETPAPSPETQTQRYLSENTAYVEPIGCSGLIYRSANGSPKVVEFAEHCGVAPSALPRIRGADGRLYAIATAGSWKVSTGDQLNSLRPAGEISAFVVPKAGDNSSDFAFGVVNGTSEPEALRTIKQNSHTDAEIAQLPRGEKLYMSGFPHWQSVSPIEREMWEMDYLHNNVVVDTSAGKRLNVVMTGVHETADGALCTNGNSGAVALDRIEETDANGTVRVSFKSLGGNVGNYDFRPGSRNAYGYSDQLIADLKGWIQSNFGVDVSNYDGVCFFDPSSLRENPTGIPENYEIVRLVASQDQIPR